VNLSLSALTAILAIASIRNLQSLCIQSSPASRIFSRVTGGLISLYVRLTAFSAICTSVSWLMRAPVMAKPRFGRIPGFRLVSIGLDIGPVACAVSLNDLYKLQQNDASLVKPVSSSVFNSAAGLTNVHCIWSCFSIHTTPRSCGACPNLSTTFNVST
jgi:hypothetical protein